MSDNYSNPATLRRIADNLQKEGISKAYFALHGAADEVTRLHDLINNAHTDSFLDAVRLEAAHQVERWGAAHDRGKSAENWFWLVGYLAGKALRSAITGDKQKALHHTISSGAALLNWHKAIMCDGTNAGIGDDRDLQEIARFEEAADPQEGR